MILSISAYAGDNKDSILWYMPDFITVHIAGNIGLIGIGAGYNLSKNIQTSLMYGYVPEVYANKTIHSIVFRNIFCLYSYNLDEYKKALVYINASLLFETGNNSMLNLTEKYPEGYYVTNSFHIPLNLGLRLHTKIRNLREIDMYAEIGTLAMYLYYNIVALQYRQSSIYSIGFGVNVYLKK